MNSFWKNYDKLKKLLIYNILINNQTLFNDKILPFISIFYLIKDLYKILCWINRLDLFSLTFYFKCLNASMISVLSILISHQNEPFSSLIDKRLLVSCCIFFWSFLIYQKKISISILFHCLFLTFFISVDTFFWIIDLYGCVNLRYIQRCVKNYFLVLKLYWLLWNLVCVVSLNLLETDLFQIFLKVVNLLKFDTIVFITVMSIKYIPKKVFI